jgi:antitoxin component YwqK of YwqJK toxin-antitoxin module
MLVFDLNKNLSLIIVILITGTPLVAQNKDYNKRDSLGRRQGIWYFIMHEKDKKYLDAMSTYKDDRQNGRRIEYYENGNVRSNHWFINDTIDGHREVFREDGTLFQIENYKMGRLHGVKQYFDFRGKINGDQEYQDGMLNGVEREYYESGRIRSESTLIDGIENGTRKIYLDNDAHEVIREFDFVNGKRVKSRFYKKGKLIKEVSD